MEDMSQYAPPVPTLEYKAGMGLLQSLWLQIDVFESEEMCFSRDKNFNDYDWFERYYYRPLATKIHALPLPPTIRKQLCTMIWRLTNTLKTWLYKPMYTKTTAVSDDDVPINFHHIKDLAFRTDGGINEIETARNILHSGRLDTNEKFQLASEYCLEDELPEVSFNFHISIDNGMFWRQMLMCFWYCRKYNKMEMIAEFNYTDLSVPLLLMTTGALNNRHSLMYFWEQLNYQEKVFGITSLINKKIKPEWHMINELKEADLKIFWQTLASHIEQPDVDIRLYAEFLEYLLEKGYILVERQFRQKKVYNKFIMMLPDLSSNFRRTLIRSPAGQRFCQDLLYFGLIEALELFLKFCLSEKEADEMKKKLIKEDAFEQRLNV